MHVSDPFGVDPEWTCDSACFVRLYAEDFVNVVSPISFAPLRITTTSLPPGTVGAPYRTEVVAAGATGPVDWSITGQPPGLDIDHTTGSITGTPTAVGVFAATITVTDAASTHQSVVLALTIDRGIQTIVPVDPGPAAVRRTTTLTATGGQSGLPVRFTVDPTSGTGVCAVSGTNGSTLRYKALGNCVVNANQAGNTNFLPAAQVQLTVSVKVAQTITFATLPATTLAQSPFTLSATSSSQLAVSFSTSTPIVCAVSGTTVTLLAAGTCTIQAGQAGNATYNPAPTITRFKVT